MERIKIRIGIMPTKREIFASENAKKEYERIMPIIHSLCPEHVEWVSAEDLLKDGLGQTQADIRKVVDRFTEEKVDALFFPFCDFGSEETVVGVAKAFHLPTLIWGSRDPVSTYEHRGKESQCGMFAATKVLQNYGVTFSYIHNCEAESQDLKEGFLKFVRVAAALKAIRNLNVASIGDRPSGFYSVIHNQLDLIRYFNISVKPVKLLEVKEAAERLLSEDPEELRAYVEDIKTRIDCTELQGDDTYVRKVAAGTLAVESLVKQYECGCAAFDCTGIAAALGLNGFACSIEGELADRGIPTACEMDVLGAISAKIASALTLGEEPAFISDWTYRHPENDNAELLWHNGPFAPSLARKDRPRQYRKRQNAKGEYFESHWELKRGPVTMLRLDEAYNEFYFFTGEGRTVEGPETTGTYVWFETDDWKRWEEKLMLGPFIHHCAGVYGHYFAEMREIARYLKGLQTRPTVHFEYPEKEGYYSL
ncbi:MAG: fucose isomerase [Lachnospiraceae bacterium]|nr:fucose isomerase [Lachnospiraceae bacterium]